MKKFKMPDSFTILFLIIIVVATFSWFVPSGSYVYKCENNLSYLKDGDKVICPNDNESAKTIALNIANKEEIDSNLYNETYTYQYEKTDANHQGLWQILNAPAKGFYNAIDIALFVIIIGGFINVVMMTGALDIAISTLLRKFNKNELMLIPILMFFFGLGGTTYGMSEETIGFYLLIVPVFLAARFDAVVGVRIILLGAGAGVLASTVNPFAIGAAVSSSGLSIGIGDGIVSRVVLFIIIEGIAILTTMRYAKKVQKDIKNSVVADLHDETYKELVNNDDKISKLNGGHKLVLTIFAATFIIMVASVIPWPDFGISIFENSANFLNEKVELISGTGGLAALGTWWFGELTMLFLTAAIIVGVIAGRFKLYNSTFIDAFIDGCKDLLGVALIIGLSRGITVVMTSSGMDATLLHYGSQLLANLSTTAFTIGSYLFFIPLSFLIPSTSGLAAASMPVIAPLADSIGGSTAAIFAITSFSAASGLVNLITPTSGVVMGGLALARIPYGRWLKHVMPTIGLMFLATIIFLVIGVTLGFVI
ncbi:MAG: YfcC family protein [Mycoplasmatales bacterium]